MKASDFFTLPESLAQFAPFFAADVAPWEWLKKIGTALGAVNVSESDRSIPPGVHIEGAVWIDPSVKLPAYATIIGPAFIGAKTEIRPGAFIRGNVIIGANCVIGNSCEFKNCILLDGVQVPHFNYVGDSVLGNKAHLGAGVICSNLRLDQSEVLVRQPDGSLTGTGLRKFGAILGDGAEVGCNAVLNPGSVLGRRALVMPCTPFTGTLPEATMAGVRQPIKMVARRD
jgi:NDP-sugar pyrophosphorylase family protein